MSGFVQRIEGADRFKVAHVVEVTDLFAPLADSFTSFDDGLPNGPDRVEAETRLLSARDFAARAAVALVSPHGSALQVRTELELDALMEGFNASHWDNVLRRERAEPVGELAQELREALPPGGIFVKEAILELLRVQDAVLRGWKG